MSDQPADTAIQPQAPEFVMFDTLATTADGDLGLLAVANAVCRHCPEGAEVRLCLEHGSAWVELYDARGNRVALPDSADTTLLQQITEAVRIANGQSLPS